ncbi:MAG: FtsX-like permease family protein [Myxococcota bacterium]
MRLGAFRLIVVLALRSLVAHRVKSAIVGGLLFCGTFVVVLGNALLDSIESGMEKVITNSLAGQLQLYAADARDPLSLFGGFGMGSTEIGEIDAFEDVDRAVSGIDGVRAVVPMGMGPVTVFGRNEVDQVLSDLRDRVRSGETAEIPVLTGRARRIVDALATEAVAQVAIADPETVAKTRDALAQATTDAFWAPFATGDTAGALASLDFLDSRIAPLASDGRLIYLRAIGTDPKRFAEVFDRFHVVLGTPIPEGKRGFLFSNRTYEELIKNRVAAELDRLHEAIVDDGGRIADDPLLAERVGRNAKQYRRITFQLDATEATAIHDWLAAELGEPTLDLDALVQKFLTFDDSNFVARYDAFYARIAPAIELYEVPVGGTITLRGFTKSGYVRAVEVPVYGTYEFTGLEGAGLQSAANLMDLVTFRDLYGKMSDRTRSELDEIRTSVGITAVSRDDAEAALFGGAAPVEATAAVDAIDVDLDQIAVVDPWTATYPVEDLDRGLALNAAVVLDDPSQAAALTPTIAAAVAPLGLQVVDWKAASGTIGQLVTVLRIVLVVALAIIFLVALIIVNNAMVMATIDRVPEIGTLRAIGAQRSTVIGLFLMETALLGLIGGGSGAGLAVAMVTWLGQVGIPAPAQVMVLMFGGPRLYPTAGLDDVAFGLLAITSVAIGSTLYPALMAARVQPIVAMQGEG